MPEAPGAIFIWPAGLCGVMSDLVDAIDAEARGDFAKALEHYA